MNSVNDNKVLYLTHRWWGWRWRWRRRWRLDNSGQHWGDEAGYGCADSVRGGRAGRSLRHYGLCHAGLILLCYILISVTNHT